MNHDDKDNTPDFNRSIDPELEARIVAWIMGEASDSEAAELERLMIEQPELALFRDRLKAAHDLAGESMKPDREPLRLSSERRADLLAKISEPTESEEEPKAVVYERSRLISWRKWIPAGAISVAASFILIFGVIRMGSDHMGWEAADMASQEFGAMPPPPAQEAPPLTLNSLKMASDPGSGRSGGEGPVLDSVSLSASGQTEIPLHQLEEKLNIGQGYASEPSDESDDRFQQENRPMAAGMVSSGYLKNEGAGKKSLNTTGDLDRVDASKPVSSESSGVRRRMISMKSSTPAPDANRPVPAKEAREEEQVIALSPFEVSKDDGDSGYRATDSLAGTRVGESREGLQEYEVSESFADSELMAEVALPKAKIASDDFKKQRGNQPFVTEVNATDEPVSTFSLHVSDVSFRTAQAALARGEWPEPATIRPEEFYNAFDYGDPVATTAEKISCRIDQAAHPVLQQRNLVRIALKVPSTGRGASQPLNLTVMVDTSGSMEREDRRESMQGALNALSSLLGPEDQVNVIGFARQPRLLEEAMPGDQAHRLAEVVANTPSEGGTNLEEALDLSVELAQRHFDPLAQNRIVLMTDGAANLGDADPESFTETIEMVRQQGISFDATGVGTDGMNDAILEALTRKGNGRYYVIDAPEDADEGFADQLAGAFRPAAENVKVQVRFNPARVGRYKLIGFEKHRLNEEDFRNDRIDAAELAADEAAVAVYQVEVLPEGEGELGEVYVRFRDPATGQMIERSWTAPYDSHAPTFERASPQVQLAGTAALVAEVLQGDPIAEQVSLDELAGTANRLRSHYAHEERVQELVRMVEHLRRIQNTGTE